MDTTIIVLLSVLTVLVAIVIYLLLKQSTDGTADQIKNFVKDENFKLSKDITKEYGDLKVQISDSIGKSSKENILDLNNFKEGLQKGIKENFNELNTNINSQMENINKKVEFRLNEGFDKTNKTFEDIVIRLTKIDEAQKNIEKLSTDVVSLQDVLTDKKSRGTFGEVQLNNILGSIFGESNTKVYETQYLLSNGKMADALLHLPEPMGELCIDSKFPLENYQRMVDRETPITARDEATKKFKSDLKKHIDDISSKYIIANETADQAVLFLPAEAVFAEINAYHPDIIDYAQKKHVWVASPTTIMSLLTTVQVILRNLDRDKFAAQIQEELAKLGQDFKRYKKRWDTLANNIDTVSKRVKEIHTTSDKIGKTFERISKVELDEIDAAIEADLNDDIE